MSTLLYKQDDSRPVTPVSRATFWLRWVLANAAGELLGLGGSALIGIILATTLDLETVAGTLLMAAGMIVLGTLLEGIVVGLCQWSVLRWALPAVSWRHWTVATAAGAGVAWCLGMIPSTLMLMVPAGSGSEAAGTMAEMSDTVYYALAAGMGFVLGPTLAVPQWVVLRRQVARAGWWVPANALAWAGGMVLVFLAAGSVPAGDITPLVVLWLLLMLLAAGAIVGAVHGWVLLRLLTFRKE